MFVTVEFDGLLYTHDKDGGPVVQFTLQLTLSLSLLTVAISDP